MTSRIETPSFGNLQRFTMPAHGHDIGGGHVGDCHVCGSDNLELVIDLGHQPLCGALLRKVDLDQPERTYPLRLWRCLECTLTQIDYAVPVEELFPRSYPYRTGITAELVNHMDGLARQCFDFMKLGPGNLVVDIGCNDGTLLQRFKKLGVRTLGVEPTDIAKIARQDGIEVVCDFFTEELARRIRSEYGVPSVITATNVFAHMNTLGEVMRGIRHLLDENGYFVAEVRYLPELLRKMEYDEIYHEHMRTYSLGSLVVLYHLYGFSVVHAEVLDRYNGNLRVFARKGRDAAADATVAAVLRQEAETLVRPEVYADFRRQIERSRVDLLELALAAKRNGQSFVGNSCPGRSSTLLNYVGIDRGLMPYICEQPTSLKLGLFLPGKHIPVVDNRCLEKEQPDYVVLLAWHYGGPITAELRRRGIRSKLVMPLPQVRVIEG